jgi:thioredoxin-like negative regulator of GroEL
MKSIKTLKEFNEVVSQNTISIVKFYTNWCPDCKRLDMFIGEIQSEHSDKQWYRIDRDEFPELADQFEVMGIPSLLVFKNGEKIGHLHSASAKTPEEVRNFLSSGLE